MVFWARVSKPGQQRRTQDPFPKGFAGSNPSPRIEKCNLFYMIVLKDDIFVIIIKPVAPKSGWTASLHTAVKNLWNQPVKKKRFFHFYLRLDARKRELDTRLSRSSCVYLFLSIWSQSFVVSSSFSPTHDAIETSGLAKPSHAKSSAGCRQRAASHRHGRW